MKKIVFLVIFIGVLFLSGCAKQVDLKLFGHLTSFDYKVVPFEYYSTTNELLSIEDILDKQNTDKFEPTTSSISFDRTTYYWLRLDFSDINLDTDNEWVLLPGNFAVNNAYYKKDGVLSVSKGGTIDPVAHELEKIYWRYHKLSPNNLIEGKYIYLQLRDNYFKGFLNPNSIELFTQDEFKIFTATLLLAQSDYSFRAVLFLGGIALLLLYKLGIYFVYKDDLYLLYGAYLLFALMYLGVKIYPMQSTLFFGNLPILNHIWNEVTQILVNFWYIRFVRRYIDAKNLYPFFNSVAKILEWAVLSFAVVAFINIVLNPLSSWLYYITLSERVMMVIIAIVFNTYLLIKRKDSRPLFIIAGSFMLLAGSVTSLILVDVQYFMIGVMAEIFIFAMGLGYLMKKREDEKTTLNKEMEKVKLRALQVQMNPHFIFNSLNSIRAYMIKNETTAASGYLSKFSRLIRQILEYSSEEFITLKQELQALSLYVQIEQLRFRDEFGFSTIVDDEIDQEEYMVPPLIVQPFLENAIWHGLMQKQGNKELELIVENRPKFLKITVRDNGIGRAEAGRNSSKEPKENKSMAIDLTTRRLEALNEKVSRNHKQVTIIDLYNEDRSPLGTEVNILLPKIMRKHT